MNAVRRVVPWLAVPVLLVAVWWTATADSTDFFWPPLRQILGTFGDTWFHGRLRTDVLPSVVRLLAGYFRSWSRS